MMVLGGMQDNILGINSSGAMYYSYNPDAITTADDWIFSHCFSLTSGTSYDISYFYRVASQVYPENLSLYIGSSPSSSSMNTLLTSHIGVTDTSYISSAISFTVPTSGIYYIGWYAYSNADMWRIYLDDISLCESVIGCTDATAMNYNPQATVSDSSCIFLFGCTDPTALNYTNALMDDGSCLYPINGCMDSLACNYNSFAVIDDGSCLTIYGCNDSTAFNYDATANCNDGSCIAIIYGCTDPLGLNYYPGANINDPNNPCCYVFGCTDPTAFNY